MEMIGARQMMPDPSSLMGTIGRQTFEISLVLLLRACCVFLSHLGTQPPPSLCQALSLSLSHLPLADGSYTVTWPLLHNIQHIKLFTAVQRLQDKQK